MVLATTQCSSTLEKLHCWRWHHKESSTTMALIRHCPHMTGSTSSLRLQLSTEAGNDKLHLCGVRQEQPPTATPLHSTPAGCQLTGKGSFAFRILGCTSYGSWPVSSTITFCIGAQWPLNPGFYRQWQLAIDAQSSNKNWLSGNYGRVQANRQYLTWGGTMVLYPWKLHHRGAGGDVGALPTWPGTFPCSWMMICYVSSCPIPVHWITSLL